MNASSFEKLYIRDQLAEAIRSRINTGAWSDHLPSERWLSHEFGVGRDQIHQAILKLRELDVVSLVGRRNRISSANAKAKKPMSVVFLTPQKLQDASRGFLFCLDHLRHRLSRKNIPVLVETSVNMSEHSTGKRLKRFTHQHPQALWILHRATPTVQRWFHNQGLPVIILGSASNNITAPYIDIDHAAAVRHSLGVMQRAGHALENILLLRPNNQLEGVQRMEESFRCALNAKQTASWVVKYSEDNTGLINKLRHAFNQPNNTPQGIITTSLRAALFLNGWLSAESGLVTGRDVSLICLADGSSLKHLHPSVAYYGVDRQKFANQLMIRVNRLLAGERGQKNKLATLLIPDFVSGDSVCKWARQ